MKRNKIKYDRWLRMLLLSLALLTGGGWMAWGQTDVDRPTIVLIHSDNHDEVFFSIKTIYVSDKRELSIPELTINQGSDNDPRYNWFVHWYIEGEGDISYKQRIFSNKEAAARGGGLINSDPNATYSSSNVFCKVKDEKGLIWSNRLRKDLNLGGCGMDVSTIEYILPADYKGGDRVYCDVSVYNNGSLDLSGSDNDIKGTYNEPTLLKRFIYEIKSAKDCINKEKDVFDIDYPAESKSINFLMPSAPENYFWMEGSEQYQGKKFQYQVKGKDTDYHDFKLVTRNATISSQQVQRIPYEEGGKETGYYDGGVINVSVIVVDETGTHSKEVAEFNFSPKKNVGFKLETEIADKEANIDRWPRYNKSKYVEIGNVDFDQDDVKTELTRENNMSVNPFGTYDLAQTSYGFMNKNISSLERPAGTYTQGKFSQLSLQNVYGLYRSANVPNYSTGFTQSPIVFANTDKLDFNKCYVWVPALNPYYQKKEFEFYDRTHAIAKESGKNEYGYFYYIDASDDPGTLVDVPISDICSDTEITVTAWLADMTRPGYSSNNVTGNVLPLAPNLNLIFKAKDGDGKEVILHRFTSGDALTDYGKSGDFNTYLMQWQQLCYSFVIDKSLDGYTNFHLEIQNNEPHTDGADYAIDDIRIFKTKPQVDLVKAGDLCETDINTLRFVTDYNRALDVLGLKKGEKVPLNQRVKKEDLPQLLQDYLKDKPDDAIDYFTSIYYSVYKESDKSKPIQINYTNLRASGKQNYRTSYVSTKLEDMVWTQTFDYELNKDLPNPKIASAPVYLDIEDRELEPGVDYIARLSTNPLTESDLDITDNQCALIGNPFQLTISNSNYEITHGQTEVIKPEDAVVNETYTITGKFWYKESIEANDFLELKDAKFNWFLGTLDEFTAKGMIVLPNGGSYSIQDALSELTKENSVADKEAIKRLLDEKYGIKDDNNKEKEWRLILGESSFEYTMNLGYQSVVIRAQENQMANGQPIKETLYCSKPVQFDLGGTPPTIDPGDPDVPDPDDPDDPDTPEEPKDPQPDKDPEDGSPVRSVRLGLIQIQDMQANQGTLRIPVHIRKSAVDERFVVDTENSKIMVCETSDQERRDGLVNKEVATLDGFGDEYVATDAKPKWDKNYFKIKFEDLAVKPKEGFREGFWYMVEIPYAVKDGNGNGVVVHRGSMKLTLKIVPEYVTWVGSENGMHNWNNDDLKHWRRSKNAELYMSGDKEGAEANGTHPEAYTPMRFTKVTIYGKAKDKDGNYAIDGNAYAAYPHLYKLSKRGTDPTVLLDMAPTNMDATIGSATKNIEYDLLADPDYEQELFGEGINFENPDKKQGHSYSCVRFYGNTCDEIYIKPESEILHTEYLTYNKAHVDYETDPNRWYMLASPLKGVVSGDMYLPTGNNGIGKYARQETPAFEDIKYNTTDYTRWEPAVYMRGWNSTSVKVIYPKDEVNYGELANWSNLYNDVDVPFVSGSGFSIGTKASSKLEKESVLFRLPKADVLYHYYENDNKTSEDEKNITSKNRQGNGRFYFSPDTTSLNVTTTGMLGNPFMSHLDMKKFFDANHSTNNTYYIMSGNTTITNIAGDEYKLSTESDDPNYVAPLQSFIKNDLKNAVFTTDMIAKAPTSGKKVGLRSATAAASEKTLPQLRITASRGGVHNTALVAGLVTASDSYIEGEDAALLINEEVAAPQVYTLAGNQMTAINVTPELKDIPVGIYGKDASPVELSFKLSGDMQNVTFVDKQSGKVYPVTDGLTLTVSGNTSGRYFLNGSIATSNEVIARNEIVCYANGNGQIVVSSVDPLTRISVYSVSGQRLRYLDNLNMQTVYVKDLVPGIYIVKAESVTQVCSEKMEVK